MTARDRIVIVVVLLAAAVAGVWFMGLSPKHKQNAELQTQIEAANQRLAAAEQKASVARRAKDRYDADFTIVDMKAKRTITHDWMATRSGWTPFDGFEAKAWPVATIVRGTVVMRDDEIVAEGTGAPVRFLETLAG